MLCGRKTDDPVRREGPKKWSLLVVGLREKELPHRKGWGVVLLLIEGESIFLFR